jgi:hypothetical protein
MAVHASPGRGRADGFEREAKNHLTSGHADLIWERVTKQEVRCLRILPIIFVEHASRFHTV